MSFNCGIHQKRSFFMVEYLNLVLQHPIIVFGAFSRMLAFTQFGRSVTYKTRNFCCHSAIRKQCSTIEWTAVILLVTNLKSEVASFAMQFSDKELIRAMSHAPRQVYSEDRAKATSRQCRIMHIVRRMSCF